ncbi:TetR/AcrR family transcriptional regulator [Baaleninema simplex]|uniref:TetR/AcrR family transcriptional regulator n=1 Tax=Baaleninema simplex TaxID=2862350 RepID=UPI000344911B|nr:TetR/AcrR family transcriptional regulator [Baaleninema simplex]
MIQKNAPTLELAPKAEQILDGAMKEFLQRGYAATSMDRVAATAGVSKATVYNHFGDKEGLFEALVKQLAERKFAQVQRSQPLQGDPKVVLRQFAMTLMNNVGKDSDYKAFVRLIIGESGRFPHLAQTFIRNLFKPALTIVTQYLAEQPSLRCTDAEAAARVFLGTLIHFVISQNLMYGDEVVPIEPERVIDCVLESLFQ